MKHNKNKIKECVSIAANLAQVGLLCLAGFGYFYTVRPIYQRDRLAEDVAHQQQVISDLKKQNLDIEKRISNNVIILNEQKHTIENKQAEVVLLQAKVEGLSRDIDIANKNNEVLTLELEPLRQEIKGKRTELVSLDSKLNNHYRVIFLENLMMRSVIRNLKSFSSKKTVEIYSASDIKTYKDHLESPYNMILSTLNSYQKNFSDADTLVPMSVRKNISNELRNKLLKRQDLKNIYLDEGEILSLINKKDIELKNIPSSLSGHEKYLQKMLIDHNYGEQIRQVLALYRKRDIDRIYVFFGRKKI